MIALLNATSNRIPLPDGSVHCVVTSPPYWGLRDYGLPPRVWGGEVGCGGHVWGAEIQIKQQSSWDTFGNYATDKGGMIGKGKQHSGKSGNQGQFCQQCGAWRGCLGLEPTPEMYVEHMVEVFREVRRVLRDDGTVWLNLGDSYASSPKSGGQQSSKMTGGEHKRTPQDKPYKRPPNLKPKDLIGIPWRVAFALQADGWWLRSDIIWSKTNPMPESVMDRPTKSHEYLFLLAKSKRYFYDADAVREAHKEPWRSTGKPDRKKRGRGTSLTDSAGTKRDGLGDYIREHGVNYNPAGRNRRTVWTISTKPYAGAHFATYPPALVEPCIKAGTSERGVCPECGAPWERVVERGQLVPDALGYKPRGKSAPDAFVNVGMTLRGSSQPAPNHHYEQHTTGWRPTCDCCRVCNHYNQLHGRRKCPVPYDPIPATVLDPFVGSGTTLMVARALGRSGIGLDLSFDYLSQQARKRLELDKLAAWGEGGGNSDGKVSLEGLPLFETLT